MNVKRYEWVACDEHACHCDVVESAEGDMVDYEDYAALEARCAALAAENAGMDAFVDAEQRNNHVCDEELNAALQLHGLKVDGHSQLSDAFRVGFKYARRITPPVPVAMKDHQIRELVNELRDIAVKYHGSQQIREHIARTIRAATLQGAESAESTTTMKTAPALDSSPKIAESPSGINQGKSEPVTTACKLRDAVEIIRKSGIEIDAEKIFAERDALNAPDCWCRTCRPVTISDMRFVVCPECGNKRCPHANDHRNACTGSNEPGQEGSAYPAAPQQEVK